MFDIASTELLLIALVALLVIGPKDLPRVLRSLGQWIAKARAVTSQFKLGFDDMIRQAELEELEKKWKSNNEKIMRENSPEMDYSDESAPSESVASSINADEPASKKPRPKRKAKVKAE
jgi:sec-independent protein translocase protein TatB